MYDAITHKLQEQTSRGWSRIEENWWTFAYLKRNSPIMLKKLPSKLYFNLCRFRKVVHFAQNPCLMSSWFIWTRDILGKKLRFLWFSFQNRIKNISIWHQKMEFSFTQSSDIYLKHHRHWENGKKSIIQITPILASISRSWKKHPQLLLASLLGYNIHLWLKVNVH